MRKIAAALLLFAAVPAFAAEPQSRDEILKALVRASRVQEIEKAAISAAVDALLAQATTAEQKDQLEQLRVRALAHDTSETWTSAYDGAFNDKALSSLVDFYKTPSVQRSFDLTASTLRETMQERVRPVELAAAERDLAAAKRTMADMRALATAIEARATDTNEYPETADMETLRKLVEPTYIRHMPSRDAWGHEFLYIGSPSHQNYRIVSAGSDGVFDAASRQLNEAPPRETDRFEDDVIFQDGQFIQYPRSVHGQQE